MRVVFLLILFFPSIQSKLMSCDQVDLEWQEMMNEVDFEEFGMDDSVMMESENHPALCHVGKRYSSKSICFQE